MLLVRWAPVAVGVFAFFAVVSLIRLLRRKSCFLGHRHKLFIAMDYHGYKNPQGIFIERCRCFSVSGEATDKHRFVMRWFCDACDSMGEHCWDKTGSWKLEHGKIVPDEKRWANRV